MLKRIFWYDADSTPPTNYVWVKEDKYYVYNGDEWVEDTTIGGGSSEPTVIDLFGQAVEWLSSHQGYLNQYFQNDTGAYDTTPIIGELISITDDIINSKFPYKGLQCELSAEVFFNITYDGVDYSILYHDDISGLTIKFDSAGGYVEGTFD